MTGEPVRPMVERLDDMRAAVIAARSGAEARCDFCEHAEGHHEGCEIGMLAELLAQAQRDAEALRKAEDALSEARTLNHRLAIQVDALRGVQSRCAAAEQRSRRLEAALRQIAEYREMVGSVAACQAIARAALNEPEKGSTG